MKRGGIGTELARLRDGEIDFRAFADATGEDFDRMAADIGRRWKVPPGVDAEDVRQELLTAVVEGKLLEKFDPARGVPLARFVVWQSYVAAKRFVHRQRGAARRDGKAQSRFPLAFSSLGRRGDVLIEADQGREGVTEADQEDAVEAKQLSDGFRCLLGGPEERAAFDVLRECRGDAVEAVRRIAGDARTAMRCGVGSVADAAALVERTLEGTRRLVREVLSA